MALPQTQLLVAANGIPSGPLYELRKGDIYELNVGAVVVNTDVEMELDWQEFGEVRRRRWINGTGPPGGPSTTRTYNEAHYKHHLLSGQTRLTTGEFSKH
jgi:hypothetical protein